MELKMRRVVIFTGQMPRMAAFYRDVLGLRQVSDNDGWKDFDAGGCNIALHNGTPEVGKRPPKLMFYCDDVAATREVLVKRGAKMGKLRSGSGLDLCDGKDPDGNSIGLSNRK